MAGVSTLQIAKQLHLSRNTVSKALNGSPEVNEKTRQRVISTALKMGYEKIPTKIANMIHTENSGDQKDICLLLHQAELNNGFWNRVLQGIEKHLSAQNCRIVLGILNADEENRVELPSALKSSNLSGVIMVGTFSETYYRFINSVGLPLVTVDSAISFQDNKLINDVVLMCNESCVYDITENIINQGIQDIAFAGRRNHCRSMQERWMGYRNAMRRHNIPINPAYDCLQNEADGFFVGKKIRDFEQLPRAVVCSNDSVAKEIIRVLNDRNVKIPEDILISGFDNFDNIPYSYPELTTVEFSIVDLGMQAARQLLYRTTYPDSSLCVIRIESHVVLRRSTQTQAVNQ